jgi:hypothetical protein
MNAGGTLVLPGLRARLTYANVMSSVAVFMVLGGTAYAAATLPANSVGSASLKAGSVTSAKVRDGSLLRRDFKPGQLLKGSKGDPGVKGDAGATGPKGDAGPLPATLPSGRSLRGAFGAGVTAGAANQLVEGTISYPFPLAAPPASRIVAAAAVPPAECPGTPSNPAAAPGYLCIFVAGSNSVGALGSYGASDGSVNYRYGAAVYARSTGPAGSAEFWGTWAVTAP